MVVAKIAEERLNENAKNEINELIEVMAPTCPDSATFIEAACWLDDIWNRGVDMVATWHGRAGPYSPGGFLSDQDFARISVKYRNNDGVAAVKKSIATLSNPQAGKWEKAFCLRVLLHVVGDLHQPLHCTQVYSEQFPEGDKGGVKFPLSGPDLLTRKHLHGFWDSIGMLDTASPDARPLDAKALNFIENLTHEITTKYLEDILSETKILSPEKWTEESYLAGKEAYVGIKINTTPSDEYIQNTRKTACKRLALAGYRLARILNTCFPETNYESTGVTSNSRVKFDVPHIPQNDTYSCATTSLAMAISHFEGHLLDKDTAWKISGTEKQAVFQYGNDMDGLKRLATHYGYRSEFKDMMTIRNLEDLLSQQALIVINVRANPDEPASHSVLVKGFDRDLETFYINDPADPQKTSIPYSDLLTHWSAYLSSPQGLSNRSGFIVYPKTSSLFSDGKSCPFCTQEILNRQFVHEGNQTVTLYCLLEFPKFFKC